MTTPRNILIASVAGLALIAGVAGCGKSSTAGLSGGDNQTVSEQAQDANPGQATTPDGSPVATVGVAPDVQDVLAGQPQTPAPAQDGPAANDTPTVPTAPPATVVDNRPPTPEPTPTDSKLPAANPVPVPTGYTMTVPQFGNGMHSWNYKYPDRDCKSLVESALPAVTSAGWVVSPTMNAGTHSVVSTDPKGGLMLVFSCDTYGQPYATMVFAYYTMK